MDREYDNNPKQEFSDEFLNAFLDNQLTLEEKDRAYLRISQDEALNRRVCELRKIQDMVRLSYQNPPALPASGAGRPLRASRPESGGGHRARHRRGHRLGTARSRRTSGASRTGYRHAGRGCARGSRFGGTAGARRARIGHISAWNARHAHR